MTDTNRASKPVLRFNYVKTSVGGSDGATVTMGFDSLDMAQDVHKWLASLQGSAVETLPELDRLREEASRDPYKAVCQGGSGGKCTDPDCEKCWPEEPAGKWVRLNAEDIPQNAPVMMRRTGSPQIPMWEVWQPLEPKAERRSDLRGHV